MDTIARLASNASNSFNGWCNASNSTIAKAQRVTPQYVSRTCTKLVKIGLMQIQENVNGGTVLRKATALWCNEIDGYFQDETKFKPIKQSLNPLNKVDTTLETKFNTPVKQSLTNNTSLIIENNKESVSSETPPTPEISYTQIETDLAKEGQQPKEKLFLTQNDLSNWKPAENLNFGLFVKLKDIAKVKIQTSKGANKFKVSTWELWLSKLGKEQNSYPLEAWAQLFDDCFHKGWTSPFFNNNGSTYTKWLQDFKAQPVPTNQNPAQVAPSELAQLLQNNFPKFQMVNFEQVRANMVRYAEQFKIPLLEYAQTKIGHWKNQGVNCPLVAIQQGKIKI
jgi:hypothetical protein